LVGYCLKMKEGSRFSVVNMYSVLDIGWINHDIHPASLWDWQTSLHTKRHHSMKKSKTKQYVQFGYIAGSSNNVFSSGYQILVTSLITKWSSDTCFWHPEENPLPSTGPEQHIVWKSLNFLNLNRRAVTEVINQFLDQLESASMVEKKLSSPEVGSLSKNIDYCTAN